MLYPEIRASGSARYFLALLGLLFVACSGRLLIPASGTLALGTWGADGAGVIVTDSVIHVHVACTFGDIPGSVMIDPDGRFEAVGSYQLRAYPVQTGPSLPAHFSGQVRGNTLRLTITVTDTVENTVVGLGPVSVVHGRSPDLGPCPICRDPTAMP